MTRPLHIRLLFAVCLLVLLAAMAAVSITTLRLDRAQMQAAQQAETEEKVRLALWRMDSLLTSIMVEESARPFSAWESFSHTEPALTKGYAPIQPGEILTPSPLLAYSSSNVLLHFQLSPDGKLTSPQAPVEAERAPALANGATIAGIETAAARLNTYQSLLNDRSPGPLAEFALAPTLTDASMLNRDILINSCAVFRTNTVGPVIVPEQLVTQAEAPRDQRTLDGQQKLNSAQWQQMRNVSELKARANFNQAAQLQAATNAYYGNQMPSRAFSQRSSFGSSRSSIYPPRPTNATVGLAMGARPPAALPVSHIAGEGVFKPLWVGSELVLARRVNFADRFVVQGVWLNWTNLRQSLVGSVKDLFPSAEILPVLAVNSDPQARMLAAIPARLVTGPALLAALPAWSPVRTALVIAWLCVLLAALAVAMLLHGTVSLSERRAAFVSAVTHELRTPLTTFKMYSEMLAEGMVPEESKRKSYLSTLCSEANRLSHLVENVLAYARLERGSARSRVERISLGQLLERVKPSRVSTSALRRPGCTWWWTRMRRLSASSFISTPPRRSRSSSTLWTTPASTPRRRPAKRSFTSKHCLMANSRCSASATTARASVPRAQSDYSSPSASPRTKPRSPRLVWAWDSRSAAD